MGEALSAGEKKHLRRVKSEIRAGDLAATFLDNEDLAVEQLRVKYFGGELSAGDEQRLRQWWRIRSTFREGGNRPKFEEEKKSFNHKLDENGSGSELLFSTLKFISDCFAKPSGR